MNFHILTLFPDMVMNGLMTSITGRAVQQHKITIQATDIRDFTTDKHRKVDDYTYGGGAGMLMQAQPVYDAWKQVADSMGSEKRIRTVYVTPQGRPFTQAMAAEFAKEEDLIILCGHYEGVDERVLEEIVTDPVSIGDYVLTGGELAAMVIVDAVSRLVPGVLHNEDSAVTETFGGYLLEYPQYSRPEVWHGKCVPQVLLSGNERNIRTWRTQQSEARTQANRPDLYAKYERLQQCKEILLRQKLLHIDMIELISRGRAELLYWEEGEILLCDRQTRTGFLTVLDMSDICPDTDRIHKTDSQDTNVSAYRNRKHGITSQPVVNESKTVEYDTSELEKGSPNTVKQNLYSYEDGKDVDVYAVKNTMVHHTLKSMNPSILEQLDAIIVHQESVMRIIEQNYDFYNVGAYFQSACTRREMLPTSGLYRPDGEPLPDAPNAGLVIHRVPMAYADVLTQTYGAEHSEAYIRERITAGAMYGAFFGEELAGFIGIHAEGSIGMLEVLPQYRRRRLGLALTTYMANLGIARGEIPYGQVAVDNEASLALQHTVGNYLSKTPVWWMEHNRRPGFWQRG